MSIESLREAAEAAVAKEQAVYECLIVEKENEMKQREAEGEKHRQQARSQHERDIAIMSASKRVAITNFCLIQADVAALAKVEKVAKDNTNRVADTAGNNNHGEELRGMWQ